MIEQWETPPLFPDYVVSNAGTVLHARKNKNVSQIPGRGGPQVNLIAFDGTRTSKQVARLVAEIFIPNTYPEYDTVMFLDGNRNNVQADNLTWRTRSYAIRYMSQFKGPYSLDDEIYFTKPVVSFEGERFLCIRDAGVYYGLLWKDIWRSIFFERPVPLIGEHFYWDKD